MYGSFDKSDEAIRSIYRDWGIGIFALPVLLAALVGLAMITPDLSNWISDAAQAEFVNSDPLPGVNPTRVVQPSMQTRTAKAN